MWLIESITSGFKPQLPITNLVLFRLLVGTIFLYKFLLETARGYYGYFSPGSLSFEMDKISGNVPVLSERSYKALYIAKIISAFCLIIGFIPKVALFTIFISFLVEVRIYFKFHTSLFALVSFSLLFANDLSSGFSIINLGPPPRNLVGSQLPAVMVATTIVILYFTTFVRKVRSKPFYSGNVLLSTLQFLHDQKPFRLYRDSYYPKIFVDYFVLGDREKLLERWRPIIWFSISLHFLIPMFLLIDGFRAWGMLLGVALHLGYTCFYQLTLVHFSFMMIASYLMFIDPVEIDSFVRSLANS